MQPSDTHNEAAGAGSPYVRQPDEDREHGEQETAAAEGNGTSYPHADKATDPNLSKGTKVNEHRQQLGNQEPRESRVRHKPAGGDLTSSVEGRRAAPRAS